MATSKKLSRVWGEKAKRRFLSQHGTLNVHELPQTDAHAIKEYDSPVTPPPPSPEELKAAEALLEAEIQKLKASPPPAQQTKPVPAPKPKVEEKKVEAKKEEKPKNSAGSFYDEWID